MSSQKVALAERFARSLVVGALAAAFSVAVLYLASLGFAFMYRNDIPSWAGAVALSFVGGAALAFFGLGDDDE